MINQVVYFCILPHTMGLLNTSALSYLGLISIIVFIYFFNRKSNIIYVPSLIPWKELNDDVVSSRLLSVDLLFFLQILLISLSALFLARPYVPSDILITHGYNKVVVIDTSASMQTIEKDGTRFDEAKKQVMELIDDMGGADKMMIISAYSSAEVLAGLENSKTRLKNIVKNLQPGGTGTDMEGGVSVAMSYMSNLKNSRLYVLTDRKIEECGSELKRLNSESYQFFRYGESSSNVTTSSVNIFQDLFNEKDEAYITVTNFADEVKDVNINVSLNRNVVMETDVKLQPDEQHTFTVDNLSSSGILKVAITTDDDLKVDNTAYGIVKKRKNIIDILLVTNSEHLSEKFQKLEDSFKQVKINYISTKDYNTDIYKAYDIIIYHNFVPDERPEINSLFIAPGADDMPAGGLAGKDIDPGKPIDPDSNSTEDEDWNSFLIPEGIITNAKILDWDNDHPTMKYLDYLDNLKINNALLFKPLKDSRNLVFGSGIIADLSPSVSQLIRQNNLPLVFSVVLGNTRSIVIGIDLEEFNFAETNNLPLLIMMINMIQWLSPLGDNLDISERSDSFVNAQIKTGAIFPVFNRKNFQGLSIINKEGGNTPVTVSGLESKDSSKAQKNDYSNLYTTIKDVGVYLVKSKARDTVFVANMFNDNEADLKPVNTDTVNNSSTIEKPYSADIGISSTTKHEQNDVSHYILYLVPLLLLIEWAYFCVRKKR